MTRHDTQIVTVDCPYECENRCTALIPGDAEVVETTRGNDAHSEATGKVRIDCPDHRFYVQFAE